MKYCFVIEPVMKRKRRFLSRFRVSATLVVPNKIFFFSQLIRYERLLLKFIGSSSIANHRHCVPMDILRTVPGDVVRFSNKEQFWARANRMQQVCTRMAALSVVDNTVKRRKTYDELYGGKLVQKGEKECRQSKTKRNRGNHYGPVDRLFRHRSRVPDVTLNV